MPQITIRSFFQDSITREFPTLQVAGVNVDWLAAIAEKLFASVVCSMFASVVCSCGYILLHLPQAQGGAARASRGSRARGDAAARRDATGRTILKTNAFGFVK